MPTNTRPPASRRDASAGFSQGDHDREPKRDAMATYLGGSSPAAGDPLLRSGSAGTLPGNGGPPDSLFGVRPLAGLHTRMLVGIRQPADALVNETDNWKSMLPPSIGGFSLDKTSNDVGSPMRWRSVLALLGVQILVFGVGFGIYLLAVALPHEQHLHGQLSLAHAAQQEHRRVESGLRKNNQALVSERQALSQENKHLRTRLSQDSSAPSLKEENARLNKAITDLRAEKTRSMSQGKGDLYRAITGLPAHQLPEMYGKVKEKTIWSYWYHPVDCPTSTTCTLPAHIQLCAESIEQNKGGFDFKIVHRDEISRYVNRIELPIHFEDLKPAQQKDSLMNALLARYGGVALDISVILLKPLDDDWNEMITRGAVFRGYMYRLNSQHWRHAEVSTVWFLMSRREGVFSTAVRNQVIGMGDRHETGAYHQWYLALGDQTLLPILSMYDYDLPKCFDDPTVKDTGKCPEHESPYWFKGITGPSRNDTHILLRDPRDGPQLPFAWLGMESWNVSDSSDRRKQWTDNGPGAPMHGCKCSSMKQCWEEVFLHRYHAKAAHPGWGPPLSLVKFFNHGDSLSSRSRKDIIADTTSYFHNWLKLAGLPDFR